MRERLIVVVTKEGATTYDATELVEYLADGAVLDYDKMHFLSDLEKEKETADVAAVQSES